MSSLNRLFASWRFPVSAQVAAGYEEVSDAGSQQGAADHGVEYEIILWDGFPSAFHGDQNQLSQQRNHGEFKKYRDMENTAAHEGDFGGNQG